MCTAKGLQWLTFDYAPVLTKYMDGCHGLVICYTTMLLWIIVLLGNVDIHDVALALVLAFEG